MFTQSFFALGALSVLSFSPERAFGLPLRHVVARNGHSTSLIASRTSSSSSIGDFGSCSVPEIEFGTGFDGRKETAFQPTDKTSYNHGSADNIAVITSFICDALTNTCDADALAKTTCANAASAAQGAAAGTGAQADAFNAVFGLKTNFAAVPEVSNTGVTVSVAAASATATAADDGVCPTGLTTVTVTVDDVSTETGAATATAILSASASEVTTTATASEADDGVCPTGITTVTVTIDDAATATATASGAADDAVCPTGITTVTVTEDDQATATAAASASASATSIVVITAAANTAVATSATATAGAATASSTLSAAQIGDFGSCSVPAIEFGTGFDGRKETAFQPVDQTSYPHGSADNIAVITSFICNELTNTCGANALAKTTCAQATSKAAAAQAGTGAQADAFNAVFGVSTDFAAVPEVSNTGVTVSVAGASAVAASTAVSSSAAAVTSAATSSASASAAATTSAAAASSTASASQIGDFGSCSVPEITFALGFDGRKETSFEPTDLVSYNHGSADNINIITQFMCDQLVNSCGADALAQSTCAQAKAAADTVTAPTGGQADAFNAVFGIKTDFAAVPVVNDQGVTQTIAVSTAAATASASV